MHFSQAVAIIQSQVGVIKGVQVLYSETVSESHSLALLLDIFDGIVIAVFRIHWVLIL